jgi:hypothetical protein
MKINDILNEDNDIIRTRGRGAIKLPSDMASSDWREPTWSFQEIAQKFLSLQSEVKFPEPPGKGAMTVCPDLQKLKDNAKLSDVATTVTVNYGTYYECAVKADAWQEWYEIQRRIFEGVK